MKMSGNPLIPSLNGKPALRLGRIKLIAELSTGYSFQGVGGIKPDGWIGGVQVLNQGGDGGNIMGGGRLLDGGDFQRRIRAPEARMAEVKETAASNQQTTGGDASDHNTSPIRVTVGGRGTSGAAMRSVHESTAFCKTPLLPEGILGHGMVIWPAMRGLRHRLFRRRARNRL